MKIIFRFLLITSLSLAFLSSNAQSIIVKGGLTMSNMIDKDKKLTYSDNYEMKMGYHGGFALDIPFSGGLSFEPGILFNTKGFKVESAGAKYTHNLNYVDIPLNLKYTLELSSIGVWGAAGPYLGVGIGGKDKLGSVETNIKFGENKNYKMLDYGVGIGAGVNIGSIVAGVCYNFGLANLSHVDLNGFKINNRTLLVSLGYKLGF